MSGTAAAIGDPATRESNLQYTEGILTVLLGAFGVTPKADPVQPVAPAPVSNPDRDSVFALTGLSIGTLALLALGIIVAVKVLK